MLFSDKSEVRNLNLQPRKACFSKARIEWNEIILNSIAKPTQPIVDLSNENLTELVQDLFGPQSFIELFDLFKASETEPLLQDNLDWPALFRKNQKNWTQRTHQLFHKMKELPDIFLDWSFAKKMEEKDLMPINGLKSLEAFSTLALNFPKQGLTRSEGKRVIDLLVDLLLMDRSVDELMPAPKGEWELSLRQLRYPRTLSSEQSQLDNSWPRYARSHKTRQGDRWVHKIHIEYASSEDLSQKLQQLHQKLETQ